MRLQEKSLPRYFWTTGRLGAEIIAADPGIEDMAPTALSLFGVEAPAWMEGRPLVATA